MPLEDRHRLLNGVIRIMADRAPPTHAEPPVSRLTAFFRRLTGQ